MYRVQRRKGLWSKVVHLKMYCAYESPGYHVGMEILQIKGVFGGLEIQHLKSS